jgi:LysM repeat protein
VVAMVSESPVAPIGRAAVPVRDRRIGATAAPSRRSPHGRMVVTGAAAVVVSLLSVVLATAAQATHAGPAADRKYVAKVMVAPGQSLWSLAETYDPHADARLIVEQIRQLNSMAGDQVQAGETLWVPRG